MELIIDHQYEIFGLIERISDTKYATYSCVCRIRDDDKVIVRFDKSKTVYEGEVYELKGTAKDFKGRIHLFIEEFIALEEAEIKDEEKMAIRKTLKLDSVIDYKLCEKYIKDEIDSLENNIIKDITKDIFNRYNKEFITYPAAVRFHHAYKYGLLFHTYNMLRLSKSFISCYPHINRDLVSSGIILHDLMKVKEMEENSSEYTKEGKLLGHLVLISVEINKTALRLGYEDSIESLLLSHIVLSSHGESQYGSVKSPQTIEALVVHLCDVSDAELQPVSEALDKTKLNEYTDSIATNNKIKFLKHELSK